MSTAPTSAVASALALPSQFHNLSVSVPEGVCEDYLAGFCPNGDDCTLRHEDIDLQSMPPANPPSQHQTQVEESVCPDFEAGFCPNGDRCPRSHANSVPEDARNANEEGDENLPFNCHRDGQRPEANAENVLNVVTPNTAPRICADYQSGFCPNGEDCPEPHDESELLVQLSAVRPAPVRPAPGTPATVAPTTVAPTTTTPAQATANAASPAKSLSTAPDANGVSHQGLKGKEKEKETARKEETARGREIADTAQKQVEPLVIPDEEIDVDALPDEPDEEVDMDAVPQMLNKPYAGSDDVEETPKHVEKDAKDESLGREDDFTRKSPGKRGLDNMEVDFGTRATAKRPRPDYSDLSYAQSEGNMGSVNGKHINPPSFRRDPALDEFIPVQDEKEPLETLAVPSPSLSPSPLPPPPPPASPPAAAPDYPPPGKMFYCEICKKDCNSQSNYQSHIRGKKHAIKEKQMKLKMRNSALRDHFLSGVVEADEIARIRAGGNDDNYRGANGSVSQGSTLVSSSLPQTSVVSTPRNLQSTSTETAQASNAQPNIIANTTENAKTTIDKKSPEKRLIEKQSTGIQPVKMQPAKSQAHPVQSAENLEVARNDLKDSRSSPPKIIEDVARDSGASVPSVHSAGHSPSLADEKVAPSSTSNLAKTSANETVGVKQVHSRGETLRKERKPSASEKAAGSTREARQRQAEESNIIPRTGTIDQVKSRTHRDLSQLAKPNVDVDGAKIHTPPSRRVGSLESIAPPAGQVEAGRLAGPTKVAEAGEHSTAKEFSQAGESGDNAKRLGSGKTSNIRERQAAEESERRKEKESRKDTERGEHPKPGKQSRVPSIDPVSGIEAARPSMRENSKERNLRPSERSRSRGTESSPEPMDIVLDRRHVQDKGTGGRSRMIASGNSCDVNDDTSSRHRSSDSRNAYSAQDPRKDYAYPNHGRVRQNSRPSEESAAATAGARPSVPRFTSRPLGPDGRMDQSVRKNDARQSASSTRNDSMGQMNRAQHPSERPASGLNPSLPRVSQDVLDKPMTIAHWKALREKSRNGSALDQLTFKILQEFLLSPSVGVGSQHLKPFSKILRHVPHYRDPEKGVVANFWSVPSALTTIEPPEGEGQQVEYSQEEISAARTFADNLLYQFYRKSSEEEDTHRRVDEELPSRGHFPKGNEGISEPNVKGNEDVTSDPLFREMEQRSVSHIRNGSQGHR